LSNASDAASLKAKAKVSVILRIVPGTLGTAEPVRLQALIDADGSTYSGWDLALPVQGSARYLQERNVETFPGSPLSVMWPTTSVTKGNIGSMPATISKVIFGVSSVVTAAPGCGEHCRSALAYSGRVRLQGATASSVVDLTCTIAEPDMTALGNLIKFD
jgi:hypothetical protein